MPDRIIYTGAVEYVYALLTVTSPGVAIDTETDTIEMGFLASDDDLTDITWTTADWETIGTTIYGRILIGAANDLGTVRLDVGTHTAYARLVKGSETIPLRASGGLVKVKAR
ncbi:MAG TPA: hypothetical protein P5305_04935 [Rubrivivax sp.]|nr:hypothetical protein [Rubrivivax sp.]